MRLSYSSIQTYETCPAKYRFQYEERLPTAELGEKPRTGLNVGLSASGLAALGLPLPLLAGFSPAEPGYRPAACCTFTCTPWRKAGMPARP